MRKSVLPALMVLAFFSSCAMAQGYYKDVFVDGGIKLTSMERLPAAVLLDLSAEYFASSRYSSTFPPTRSDTLIQDQLFKGSEMDLNGILLYPDGAPRFRMIYVNGGKAESHGKSLGEVGLQRIRSFVAGGGSYVGSCAGAFLASAASFKNDTLFPRKYYLGIWPGAARGTGLSHSYTGMTVVKGSPLLDYFNFGSDYFIDSVRHNGGCFAFTGESFPPETEVLLRYNYPDRKKGRKIDGEISAWAYKSDTCTGRVVVIGSHPESIAAGEQLDLMAAMIQYAMDGTGIPHVKAELKNNAIMKMYKSTSDNVPDSTMIGDRQYHHFIVRIPSEARNISVILNGAEDYDLFLYMRKGDFAFRKESEYRDITGGASKQLSFGKLEEGVWYIGVECYTTVETVETAWGVEYSGPVDVLNGVPYSIMVKWE